MSDACRHCGSPAPGRICHFCGTLTRGLDSAKVEAEAIAELHAAINDADDETRARLLKNGPLPSDRDVLIDAALRTCQLLDPSSFADDTPQAAIARIQAMIMKLRVLAAGDPVATRAIAELEAGIARYEAGAKTESAEGSRVVLILGLILLAMIGGCVFWLKR